MNVRYKAGLVKIADSGHEPNYQEAAIRLSFAQVGLGLNAVFLPALQNTNKEWVVPFFCAEDGGVRFAAAEFAIETATPYELVGVQTVKVGRCDIDTVRKLMMLMPTPARPVCADDLRPKSVARHLEHPEDVFEGLVGMDSQREFLTKVANAVAKHGRGSIESFHLVFKGAPGTGKTELAKRFCYYLDSIGVTDGSGRFVKAGEADLVGSYVGHTAPLVRKVVQSALGGVLFIDEFYAIANACEFGYEAIDALTDQLDEHRHDLVCIVAGYSRHIDATLAMNPGLKDRFGYEVEFADYDPGTLAEIFVSMAGKRGFAVEDTDAVEECAKMLRGSVGFSNARTMRKLVDHCVLEASSVRDEAKISAHDVFAATNRVLAPSRATALGFV